MPKETEGLEPKDGEVLNPSESEVKDDKAPYEKLEKELKEKREAEAKYRTERNAARADVEKLSAEIASIKKNLGIALGYEKTDENTDLVKAADEKIKQTESRAKNALLKAEFKVTAIKEEGLDPDLVDDAFKLADLSGVTVDLETLGVEGLGDAVKLLREGKAYLFGTKVTDVGKGGEPAKEESKETPAILQRLKDEYGVLPETATEMYEKNKRENESLDDFVARRWAIKKSSLLKVFGAFGDK